MDDRDERQQVEELRALLKRAERIPSRTGPVRKDALKRLIEVVHSPYTNLKILAANNFKNFIKDFPELEDDAINAVYDLCEDSVAKVRIDGYLAIVSVSKEQKKWVKRNADVLVQLLQSDEPEEVAVVKKSLTEHLDMDPVVTLGVLCDQIVPVEEDLNEEEQAMRDRLRFLVLSFLTGEAHRRITERHAHSPSSPAEEVLVSGILKAIPRLPHTDVNVAVKDLLLSLTSFSRLSERGEQLLEVVLDAAKSSLKTELASGIPQPPLPNTTFFLDLAYFIVHESHVASPKALLQFYCTSVVSKLTLMKLPDDAKSRVITHIADLLSSCDELATQSSALRDDLNAVCRQVIDSCTLLLPTFVQIKDANQRPWRSLCVLLQACARRKKDSSWTLPSPLLDSLEKIREQTEGDLQEEVNGNAASIREAQDLIRPLLPLHDTSAKSIAASSSTSNKGASKDKTNGAPVTIHRNREGPRSGTIPAKPNSLPPKPPPSKFGVDVNGASSSSESRHLLSSSIEKPPSSRSGSRNESRSEAPSLLSRLAATSQSLPADSLSSRPSTPSIPAKRRAAEPDLPRHPSSPDRSMHFEPDKDPELGFSIKGAARRHSDRQEEASPTTMSSLLERLGEGDSGERRGKKRTRNY